MQNVILGPVLNVQQSFELETDLSETDLPQPKPWIHSWPGLYWSLTAYAPNHTL